MKKACLIILILTCFIAACKVDESGLPQKQTNSLLIGTWYVKTVVSTEPSDPNYGVYTESDFTNKDYFKFNSDNTATVSYSQPDTAATANYSYVNNASGQKITIGNASDLGIYIVNKLTADSLVMTTTSTISEVLNGKETLLATTYLTYKLAHK